MVNSVDNSFNQLQRIQQLALANLKERLLPVAQSQNQKTSVVPVQFNAVQQAGKSTAFALPTKTLPPRGSIVDKLV
jgi:hypothetical protein